MADNITVSIMNSSQRLLTIQSDQYRQMNMVNTPMKRCSAICLTWNAVSRSLRPTSCSQ